MAELYAICRNPGGNLEVKRVLLSHQVQVQLDGLFLAQEAAFLDGVTSEIPFDGDWKPDPDELLVAAGLPEAQVLVDAIAQNAVALPHVDPANFETEGIKGIFATFPSGGGCKALIQNFSSQQMLARRFSILSDGNVFRRLTEPGFALGEGLVAIMDTAGTLRFKSFVMLRRVFDLALYYQQATNNELAAFCGHPSLNVLDINAFMWNADEGVRKAVHRLARTNVLGLHTVTAIHAQAVNMQFPLIVAGGQILVPSDRKNAKELLSFLLDRVYRGAINGQLLISNSTRPL